MTSFSFYKLEGRSSYMLNVSTEEEDNPDQSSQDQQVKGHSSIPDPEAFYNMLSTYTERIVQGARSCWNHMSCRQRARFGPLGSSSKQEG